MWATLQINITKSVLNNQRRKLRKQLANEFDVKCKYSTEEKEDCIARKNEKKKSRNHWYTTSNVLTYVNGSSGSFSSLFLCCAPQNERKNIKFLTVQKVFKHYKNLVSIQNIFTSCVCQLTHEKCAVSDWIWARKKKKPPSSKFVSTNRTSQVARKVKWNQKH